MAAAAIYHSAINGLAGFLFSFEGIVVGIALLIVPYLMGGMGAGDAKLMGAVGGLLGPKGVFVAFLFTALVGGVYAFIVLVSHRFFKKTCSRHRLMLSNFFLTRKFAYIPPSYDENKTKLRYGVAIAIGTFLSVFLKDQVSEILNII